MIKQTSIKPVHNSFTKFINLSVERKEGYFILEKDLVFQYNKFCGDNNLKPIGLIALTNHIKNKLVPRKKIFLLDNKPQIIFLDVRFTYELGIKNFFYDKKRLNI